MHTNRRTALKGLGLASLLAAGGSNLAFAQPGSAADTRLVFVFLRGAMDGLAVFPAYGDPDFVAQRNGIAMPPPGEEGGVLDLDGFFGIHPLIGNLKGMYDEGDVAVVQAVASPYRERSHFDGQNLVENGSDQPYGLNTGWLNRAVVGLPSPGKDIGVSITTSMPVVMRGEAPVTSWSPSRLPQPDAGLVSRVQRLYAEDPDLLDNFLKAKEANAGMVGASDGSATFPALMRAAATFLKSETGPRVAFLELGGWDTHAGQMGFLGPLHQNLVAVNDGVAAFKEEIGPVWDKTAVVFVTEFGRTVAMNGSNGTDHGTGGAAFLMGGSVNGGKVYADWPGLKPAQQYEGRDLQPTLDMRALFKGLLIEQLGVEPQHLETEVCPDSAAATPFTGLIRA